MKRRRMAREELTSETKSRQAPTVKMPSSSSSSPSVVAPSPFSSSSLKTSPASNLANLSKSPHASLSAKPCSSSPSSSSPPSSTSSLSVPSPTTPPAWRFFLSLSSLLAFASNLANLACCFAFCERNCERRARESVSRFGGGELVEETDRKERADGDDGWPARA